MAEWFKAPVLKTGVGSRPPWVRIPPPPPLLYNVAAFLGAFHFHEYTANAQCLRSGQSANSLQLREWRTGLLAQHQSIDLRGSVGRGRETPIYLPQSHGRRETGCRGLLQSAGP
ncbi:protein of unknown function [Candidatus Filomicrobium marinum]|uniref:Uncharacterized protein n=1 Tax=Candidatus Filomicrobium marinum TaxID=1608628 RepID=A0A0D6JJA4_9HYPH|nr:protein of unknown function [Candidatus Filomicrobium marinum]CPR21700.1 protein of unknown function [Candidatus Filomicrobium marinum]